MTITHPTWCTRPEDERLEESHVSPAIDCNPAGDELAAISVELHRYWLPDLTSLIGLEITVNAEKHWYPLTYQQAATLCAALDRLLQLP